MSNSFFTKSEHVLSLMELSVTFCEMFWTFAFVLIFCELGEMVTSQFDAFNDALERCNWYSFPIEIQQMMIIVLANAQQPITIRAFGNIICTRETFKKVINPVMEELSSFNEKSTTFELLIVWNAIHSISYSFVFQTINASFSYFMLLRGINQ